MHKMIGGKASKTRETSPHILRSAATAADDFIERRYQPGDNLNQRFHSYNFDHVPDGQTLVILLVADNSFGLVFVHDGILHTQQPSIVKMAH